MQPQLLTVPDVAHLLRLTPSAVRSMLDRRSIPGVIRIGRRIRFDADVIHRWIEDQRDNSALSAAS